MSSPGLPHPPLFVCILQKLTANQRLECHLFVCGSTDDAIRMCNRMDELRQRASGIGPLHVPPPGQMGKYSYQNNRHLSSSGSIDAGTTATPSIISRSYSPSNTNTISELSLIPSSRPKFSDIEEEDNDEDNSIVNNNSASNDNNHLVVTSSATEKTTAVKKLIDNYQTNMISNQNHQQSPALIQKQQMPSQQYPHSHHHQQQQRIIHQHNHSANINGNNNSKNNKIMSANGQLANQSNINNGHNHNHNNKPKSDARYN